MKISIAFLMVIVSTAAVAQPVRLEVGVAPYATHFDENSARQNGPELTGNSFTALPIRLEAQLSGRDLLRVPFWLGITTEIPIVTMAGDEVGKTTHNGAEYTVQKEQSEHRHLTAEASLGFDILPFLQPYLAFEYSRLSTLRTDQQNGQADGVFLPDPNQSYTETVRATYLGVGVMSVIPLLESYAERVRLNVSYLNAQGVSVTNDYFGPGSWGEHTSGYELRGRIAFETATSILADSYLTLGLTARHESWNGDGVIGNDVFQHPQWPQNSVTEVGAFAGLGLFF